MFHSNRKPKLILTLCGPQDGVRISNPARDVGVFQSCCPAIARVFCQVHRGSKKRQRKRIRDTYKVSLILTVASHSRGTPSVTQCSVRMLRVGWLTNKHCGRSFVWCCVWQPHHYTKQIKQHKFRVPFHAILDR